VPDGAAHEHRLTGRGERRGQFRVAGTQRPRGALAVHEQPPRLAVHGVSLFLAGVVRHVVDQRQPGLGKEAREHLPRQMRQDLPVGQRAVDGRPHGAQILAPECRFERRTGQFAVRQHDAVLRRGGRHARQEIGAHLVAQAARAAMDADHDLALAQAEGRRRGGVEHGLDRLHLQIMVAGAERAHLVALAVLGLIGHGPRIGAGHAAAFLDARQILRLPVAAIHRPAGAAGQHDVQFGGVQVHRASAAKAAGDGLEQRLHQRHLDRIQFGTAKAGVQHAHAAGHVETDAAGRHHAAGGRIEGGHAADRKAVARMRVRQRIGGQGDAGQAGDVADLLRHLVVHVGKQRRIGVDHARHAHGAAARQVPLAVAALIEQLQVHGAALQGRRCHGRAGAVPCAPFMRHLPAARP